MPRLTALLSVALCLLLPLTAARAGIGAPPEACDEPCTGEAAGVTCAGDTSAAGRTDEGREGCAEQCPGDALDGTCPVGCDDCTCCFAAMQVFVLAASAMDGVPPARLVVRLDDDEVTLGVRSRIYRPPRLALTC